MQRITPLAEALESGRADIDADGIQISIGAPYDSGPRNVSSLLANGWTGTAYIQRTGSDVQLRLEGITAPSAGSTSPYVFGPGFMPRGASYAARGLLFTTATNPVVRRFDVAATTGALTVRNVTAGDVLYGEVSFKTENPIPADLPGSAA